MMDADAKALKEASRRFEAKYGIEAFLDAMAAIMQDRLGDQGLTIEFFENEIGDHNEEAVRSGGDHRSVQRDRASHR
ncbi:hypothetical protein [Agrobacterium tumefaciens]|uniref:hypothetical protein n=1 Tax=Agrobacterium tumefaciens TaxID=358 RepID=UPI0003074860|nr:hypothetical protein [Agrobacterium tumefaciens]NTZ63267.1 hypothetical protein [Agrobacterium tumefaciens]UXR94867.1 hypothetical protein FY157_24325 [Agrobacterium tumefaciens]